MPISVERRAFLPLRCAILVAIFGENKYRTLEVYQTMLWSNNGSAFVAGTRCFARVAPAAG